VQSICREHPVKTGSREGQMRSKMSAAVAAASAALLLSACAGQAVAGHGEPAVAAVAGTGAATSGGATAAGTSTSAGNGAAHTTAELQAALLTINDLGSSGWAVEPSDDSSDDDDSDDPTCGADDPGDDAHQAEVDFSQGEVGPFLFEQLYSTASAAVAKADFAQLVSTVSSCSGTTESDGSSATITDMSFPKFGDQSHGYRLIESVPEQSTSPGDDSVAQTIPADVVVVQDGALLETFFYIDLTGGGVANLPTAVKNGVARAHALR
jgi:hypothetical protein